MNSLYPGLDTQPTPLSFGEAQKGPLDLGQIANPPDMMNRVRIPVVPWRKDPTLLADMPGQAELTPLARLQANPDYKGPNPYQDLTPHHQWLFDSQKDSAQQQANVSYYFTPAFAGQNSSDVLNRELDKHEDGKAAQAKEQSFTNAVIQTMMPGPVTMDTSGSDAAMGRARAMFGQVPQREKADYVEPSPLSAVIGLAASFMRPDKAFDFASMPFAWAAQDQATRQAWLDQKYAESVKYWTEQYKFNISDAQRLADNERVKFQSLVQQHEANVQRLFDAAKFDAAAKQQKDLLVQQHMLELDKMSVEQKQLVARALLSAVLDKSQDPQIQAAAARKLALYGLDWEQMQGLTDAQKAAAVNLRILGAQADIADVQARYAEPNEAAKLGMAVQQLKILTAEANVKPEMLQTQLKAMIQGMALTDAQIEHLKAQTQDMGVRNAIDWYQAQTGRMSVDNKGQIAEANLIRNMQDSLRDIKLKKAKAEDRLYERMLKDPKFAKRISRARGPSPFWMFNRDIGMSQEQADQENKKLFEEYLRTAADAEYTQLQEDEYRTQTSLDSAQAALANPAASGAAPQSAAQSGNPVGARLNMPDVSISGALGKGGSDVANLYRGAGYNVPEDPARLQAASRFLGLNEVSPGDVALFSGVKGNKSAAEAMVVQSFTRGANGQPVVTLRSASDGKVQTVNLEDLPAYQGDRFLGFYRPNLVEQTKPGAAPVPSRAGTRAGRGGSADTIAAHMTELGSQLKSQFPGARFEQYADRTIAGSSTPSTHSFGGSIDAYGPLPEINKWALQQPGVEFTIYNRRMYYPDGTSKPYGGKNPHTDHVHIQGAGAQKLISGGKR